MLDSPAPPETARPVTLWVCPDCGSADWNMDGHCRAVDEHSDGDRPALVPVEYVPVPSSSSVEQAVTEAERRYTEGVKQANVRGVSTARAAVRAGLGAVLAPFLPSGVSPEQRKEQSMGDQTLDLSIHVRHVTEEEARAIELGVADAVVSVIGRIPNGTTHTLTPDYDGPGRSEEEERRAAEEGRR